MMKRHSNCLHSPISFLSPVVVLLFVVATLPEPAMAQRFGDGRVLRQIFGFEREEATVEPPQLPNPAASSRPPSSNTRVPANPYSKNYPRQSYPKKYTVSPTRTGQPKQTPPRTVPPRVNVVPTKPMPTPARPQSESSIARSRSQQDAYARWKRKSTPKSTPKPTTKSAPELRPIPAAKSFETLESPLEQEEKISEVIEEKDNRKIVKHDDFGVTVRMRGDHLAIDRVQSDGTADAAGIKKGDTLISVGEIPMKRPADIEQLDEVLKAGDQVEFEIVRKGKKSKKLVAFKKEAALDELPTLDDERFEPSDNPPNPTARNEPTPALRLDDGYGDFEPTVPGDELRQLVETQQQIIARLQSRISELEQAADTPDFRASKKKADGPKLVFPPQS